MTSPIILINKFIDDYKNENSNIIIEDFKKKLYEDYSIMTKYDENDNIMLLYHKYDMPTNSDFEQECRSLVLDMETMKVISYTCPNPILNKNAQQFLLNNSSLELDIYKCYEGTVISLFHYKNKWFISTRRCLNSKDSIWKDTNYYDMFMDVINKENITFDEFVNKLDKNLGYYFILIHYKNKHIIDYTQEFGDDYTKLCLVFVRNNESQCEVTNYELNNYTHIIKPSKITMEEFANQNKQLSINIDMEGIIIKTVKDNKNYLIKLQTNSYQFCKAIGNDSNILKGYLYLYQNDSLKKYIKNNKNLDRIINPYDTNESFDTIGVIDSVFKVLTSELFELYKLLWKLNNGKHQNTELYNILPKEFKDILYNLRGIYYKMKAEKQLFKIKHIYEYLKNVETDQLCALLRQRKLMFNWVSNNNDNNKNLEIFNTISNHCDKINIKLISIFINKIFPEVLSSDLPLINKK